MKQLNVKEFMQKVRQEAGEASSIHTAVSYEPLSLSKVLSLNGKEFVMGAYRKFLMRDADSNGMETYIPLSETLPGKLRVLFALYKSNEFLQSRAISKKRTHWIHIAHTGIVCISGWVRRLSRLGKPVKLDKDTDAFYYAFEEKYRQNFDIVYARLATRYTQMFEEARLGGAAALDLGCGRGESVALLTQCGFKAVGVDSNHYSIQDGRTRGIDVRLSDIFAYLTSLPNESQSLVTSFHVIEHLSFERMWHLMDEIYRVLEPGGMVLFETPNICHPLVYGGNFYRDPTHVQHIYPHTLTFLLNRIGFEGSVHYFSETDQPIAVAEETEDFVEYSASSEDMAWIGRKSL